MPVGYPVTVTAREPAGYTRLLPLVKWLLLVPHYVVLFFLGTGAGLVAFIAFFATIVTGRYPLPLWSFMVGVQRWALRVTAYLLLMTDRYPPFSLSPREGDEVHLDAVFPERVERWRPLVTWLLVIPYAVIAALIFTVAQVCAVIAFFTILATRKMPEGVFPIMRVGLIWQTRANFYLYWLTTEYPPFRWEAE
jgi:hypothetical protein